MVEVKKKNRKANKKKWKLPSPFFVKHINTISSVCKNKALQGIDTKHYSRCEEVVETIQEEIFQRLRTTLMPSTSVNFSQLKQDLKMLQEAKDHAKESVKTMEEQLKSSLKEQARLGETESNLLNKL